MLQDAAAAAAARPRGLTEAQIEALPCRTLPEGAACLSDPSLCTCAICMDDLEAGDGVLELPCRHVFHKPCLAEWLAQKNECPNCRRCVRDEAAAAAAAAPAPAAAAAAAGAGAGAGAGAAGFGVGGAQVPGGRPQVPPRPGGAGGGGAGGGGADRVEVVVQAGAAAVGALVRTPQAGGAGGAQV